MRKFIEIAKYIGIRTKKQKSYLTIIPLIVVTVAMATSLVTYSILTGMSFIELSDQIIINTIIINSLFIVLLLALLVGQFYQIHRNKKDKKNYAPKLQTRMLFVLIFATIIPTAMVAIFAYNTMQRSLDSWFAEKTKKHINNAEIIAEIYIEEHNNNIKRDAIAMARDLQTEYFSMLTNPIRFNQFIRTQVIIRSLAAAYIFNVNENTISYFSRYKNLYFKAPEQEMLFEANKGKVVTNQPDKSNQVQAMIQLTSFGPGYYLMIYRYLDPNVIEHLRQTKLNVEEYLALEKKRDKTELAFAIVFIAMSLVILLSVLWAGIAISKWLAKPLIELTDAAKIVAQGDFKYKLKVNEKQGEVSELAKSFNYMTSKIDKQHKMLTDTNAQLDDRNRFTEAVLSRIDTGIISVGKNGNVNLVNKAAEVILGKDKNLIIEKPIGQVLPELKETMRTIRNNKNNKDIVKKQIQFIRKNHKIIVEARIDWQKKNRKINQTIITLDDITQLVSAQRHAAWAEVARRVAHEIKNPLTPIQLSTERLKRKYVNKIKSDEREIFNQCTDTIIRQVSDIGKMVEDFTNFSYTPTIKIEKNNLADIVKNTVELERLRNSNIVFKTNTYKQKFLAKCDRRLISQALVNIFKNAIEAIEAGDGKFMKGVIEAKIKNQNQYAEIKIIDNGIGLPQDKIDNLTEPYVTSHENGTGLGLAIVKRIMEQHQGTVKFNNNYDENNVKIDGATVTIRWPLVLLDQKIQVEHIIEN